MADSIPIVSSFLQGDTAASGNSYVKRGADGSITGTAHNGSSMNLSGLLAIGPGTVYTASATIGSTAFNQFNATSGAVTVTLPAAALSAGLLYVVQKTDGGSNVVTIDPNGSETVNGATTYAMATTQWSSVVLYCWGTASGLPSNWTVVAKF